MSEKGLFYGGHEDYLDISDDAAYFQSSRMNNVGQNYDFKSDPQYSDTTGTNELTRSGGGKGGSSSEDQSGNSKSDFIMEDGSAAPRKRKPLTADEKSKQNRDRNRDHAKNTRLRKKAYVIKLKELVDELTEQKVNEEGEAQMLEEKLNEVHTKRKNIVRLFLKYRSSNMNDYNQWAEILDENFVFTLPITPYRSFHKAEIVNSCRVVRGISATISDNCSLALMVESLGWGSPHWREAVKQGNRVSLKYATVDDDLLVAGDLIMCKYVMTTEGHANFGSGPVVQHGMLQCKFNRENKIVAAEMVFDVMGYMQQLQRASSITPESSIVPNTLEMALQPTREARAIIRNQPPHHAAIHVNEAWTTTVGQAQSEAEGVSLTKVLRVDPSQQALLYNLSRDVAAGRPGSVIIISGHAQALKTLLYLKMFPLTGDSDVISHFLLIVCDLPLTAQEQESLYASSTGGSISAPLQPLVAHGALSSSSGSETLRESLNFPLGSGSKSSPAQFNYYPSALAEPSTLLRRSPSGSSL